MKQVQSVSQLSALADDQSKPLDKGATRIAYISEDGRQMTETRRLLLDGSIKVTVRDVIAGTEADETVTDAASLWDV